MNTLPKETEERIKKDSIDYANLEIGDKAKLSTSQMPDWDATQDDYSEGAKVEATRALPLLEALEQFIKHHESGILPNRLAYDFGKHVINNYNNPVE